MSAIPPPAAEERHRTADINRLKQWRGIATRYEKTAAIYLAGLYVAGIFHRPAR
ncbi:hypothetical protein ACFTZI_00835 [Streptomyces decoyicus]|uniref:hypothetical protein n=1 Tax=Streptomyces decoyicus TaxID=249567 RepID=UPI003637912D